MEDPSLPEGTEKVRVQGVPGELTLTYEVTWADGVQTGRVLVSEVVTRAPVTQVTAVGTMVEPPQPACDPNYSGCVPVAPDVDCAGGSGNGPAYARGPVTVTGRDIYGLDADNDGVACE